MSSNVENYHPCETSGIFGYNQDLEIAVPEDQVENAMDLLKALNIISK